MELKRCRWADPASELYIAYHDQEWGRPEHDDRKLFEMLILEGPMPRGRTAHATLRR